MILARLIVKVLTLYLSLAVRSYMSQSMLLNHLEICDMFYECLTFLFFVMKTKK